MLSPRAAVWPEGVDFGPDFEPPHGGPLSSHPPVPPLPLSLRDTRSSISGIQGITNERHTSWRDSGAFTPYDDSFSTSSQYVAKVGGGSAAFNPGFVVDHFQPAPRRYSHRLCQHSTFTVLMQVPLGTRKREIVEKNIEATLSELQKSSGSRIEFEHVNFVTWKAMTPNKSHVSRLVELSSWCSKGYVPTFDGYHPIWSPLLKGKIWSDISTKVMAAYGDGRNDAHIFLDRDSERREIRIFTQSVQRQQKIEEKLRELVVLEKVPLFGNDPLLSCTICFDNSSPTITASCGHSYCEACYTKLALLRPLPVHCVGNENNCQKVWPTEEIAKNLPTTVREKLELMSLRSFANSNPQSFFECPLASCTSMLEMFADAEFQLCSGCHLSICNKCKTTEHNGLSCDAFTKAQGDVSRFITEDGRIHRTKDCPSCGVKISKTFGCDHMICGACGKHFCYICLEKFTSRSSAYTHIEQVHGRRIIFNVGQQQHEGFLRRLWRRLFRAG